MNDDQNLIYGFILWISLLIIGFIFMGGQKRFILINKENKIIKDGYYGYSWTYWLFGGFVPFFRGEFGTGVLHLIIQLFTFGISQLIFPFLYNKQYSHRMLEKGYEIQKDQNNEVIRYKLRLAK